MSRKVSYIYNEDISNYQFSKDHFMKPRRIKITHSLVNTFRLQPYLQIVKSREATSSQLSQFHHPHYVQYLQTWITPPKQAKQTTSKQQTQPLQNQQAPTLQKQAITPQKMKQMFAKDRILGQTFKINHILDCPGFQGLYKFARLAAGASLDAADSIITGIGDIVINWSGGYHHAKRNEASGFCYVNDIVLCILELLKFYPRVLYLDIDVHHGDGVEQAFYNTNRVMTVSFHQYGDGFFPETGSLNNIGQGAGKYYTVNVPLAPGIDDQHYFQLFKCVMDRVVGTFRPDVFVVQSGADSLSRDRLGNLNLSIKGHGNCLRYMKSFNVPMILLGGGGYTIQNVARCWAYETGLMLGVDIGEKIPEDEPYHYYYLKDNYKIHFDIDKVQNQNSVEYLNYIIQRVTQNMRHCEGRPSVQFHQTPKLTRAQDQMEEQEVLEIKSSQYFGRRI